MRHETTGRRGIFAEWRHPASNAPAGDLLTGAMHRREGMRRDRQPEISSLNHVLPARARAAYSIHSAMIVSSPHAASCRWIRFTQMAIWCAYFLRWRRVFLSRRLMPRPNIPQNLDAPDWMAAVIIRPSLPLAMTSHTIDSPARTFSLVCPA